MKTFRLIWGLITYRPGLHLLNVLVGALYMAMPLFIGLLMKQLFDQLSGEATTHYSPGWLVGGIGLVMLLRIGVNTFGSWIWYTEELMLNGLLRRNMLNWVMKGPGAQQLPGTTGEAISRFRDDPRDAVSYLELSIDLLCELIFCVAALCIMWRINPWITMATVVPAVFIVLTTTWMSPLIRKYRRAQRRASARVTSFIGEICQAVQAIKVSVAEPHVLEHIEELNEVRRKAAVKDTLFGEVLSSTFRNLLNLSVGVVLIMAGGLMQRGEFTVGDFALFLSFLTPINRAMVTLGQTLAQHKRTTVSHERMKRVMKHAPEASIPAHHEMYFDGAFPPLDPQRPERNPFKNLRAHGLSYHYPHSTRGIQEVSLDVPAGSLTVVTGRIGSGKTTLLKVLLGLLEREKGAIYWNDEKVDDPGQFLVPPRCAFTPQVPVLFSDTLRDNIQLGIDYPPEELERALRLCVMEPDLAELEDGIDTLIGPRGIKLSGGQNQRTAAARMFIQRSSLVVCDDLSSALDVETEAQLWQRLFEEGGVTCLVSSHRRALLQQADLVIVMKEGHVEAQGTLKELLESSEEMRKLWNAGSELEA